MAKTPELDVRDNYLQNYIINGNFDFWQRGTSFSIATGGAYAADRWKQGRDGSGDAGTLSRQAFALGQTAVPGEPTYYLQYNQTTAGTGTTVRALEHRIESVRTLAGKTITVSFYMQADTNRTVGVFTQQVFGTGGSPSSLVNTTTQNITVTSSWQKFSLTFNIASIAGKTLGTNNNDFLSVVFTLPLNAVMTINLAQVQVNEGTESPPFRLAGGNIEGELRACQRYFEKSYNVNTNPGTITFEGTHADRGNTNTIWYKVNKRSANVTLTAYSPTTGSSGVGRDATAATDRTFNGAASGESSYYYILTGAATTSATETHWTADAEL